MSKRTPIVIDSDDLDDLHENMGLAARGFFDTQKVRVAAQNRITAMEKDEFKEIHILPFRASLESLQAAEHVLELHMVSLVRQHPMRPWIDAQRGIGLKGFVQIFGIAGPLDNFGTVSKLWKYLGYAPLDGRTMKRKKGQRLIKKSEAEQLGVESTAYSPQGRAICSQIGESIVKVGGDGPYRAAYDFKKAEYLARERTGPSNCPFGQEHRDNKKKLLQCGLGHADNAAIRYAVKALLKAMWIAWRQYVPLQQAA